MEDSYEERLLSWAFTVLKKEEPGKAAVLESMVRGILIESDRLRKELEAMKAEASPSDAAFRAKYQQLYEFAEECQGYVSDHFQWKWELGKKDLEKFKLET